MTFRQRTETDRCHSPARGFIAIGLIAAGAVAAALWRQRRPSDDASSGVLDAAGVRRLYDRVAPLYDLLVAPYDLINGRRLAEQAISELRLEPGDTVVDLGTGTGWNLTRLAEAVGPTGHVIGVDISPEMLDRARRRTESHGLDNVDLIEADIAHYSPPDEARAVIAAFSIEMLADYDEVIERLSRQLPPNGRIAVTGMRDPDGWPEWIIRIGSALNRPFGVSEAYRDHHPWEAIRRHTIDSTYAEAIGGVIYVAAGSPMAPASIGDLGVD